MEKKFKISTKTFPSDRDEFLANYQSPDFNYVGSNRNWAFIDMQNLYKGIKEENWRIDWFKFRRYLSREHNVEQAIIFMGFIESNIRLYADLLRAGFALEFRHVTVLPNGEIDGGNCDADLACVVMDCKYLYDRAIIVADDGDYCKLIQRLNQQSRLKQVISVHSLEETSSLIKEVVTNEQIISIHNLRGQIEYKK